LVDGVAKKKTNLNLLMEMILFGCRLGRVESYGPSAPRPALYLRLSSIAVAVPVATVLVQNGTLNAGDNFVVGNVYGKVRAMFDDPRRTVEDGSSFPRRSEIIGMEALPKAGDQFVGRGRSRDKRAAFPNTASRNHAKPHWPRVRASRWKGWRSRSRPRARRN